MLPWFEGNIFDVALVRGQHRDIALTRYCPHTMLPSPYKGFVKGSIFIIKIEDLDRGFDLSQQLKELIYSKG